MSRSFVINLVNTAFGVTVLAVPYCFHQCGLILGTLLLVGASYASKKSCSLLLRSAQISRKRDFESLGFHVGGFLGKFIVEMSLIGYLVGTAITWFVIIGDVSPAVVSSIFGIEKTWSLRSFLIVAIGLGVVLPLALVKDINSLSSASKVAIGIYTIFVLQLFFSTLPRIASGDWVYGINFWKPDGVLQCLPIFGISFLCQTVIFVLYEALPEPSGKKMEHIVNTAMDIVLLLSFTVGFSGYVMYYEDGVHGDLLNNYKHDFISEFIRLGFCISTILSFPLLVFPCRASINSLISSTKMSSKDGSQAGGTYIPHDRFVMITLCLIIGAFVCGVLFPNVEFVMALVGATMGALLTFILPAYIFLKLAGKDSSKMEAKVLLVLGLCLLCLSTFSVLSISESQVKPVELHPVISPVRPILHPLTMKPNETTLTKPTEALIKIDESLSKRIEVSNDSLHLQEGKDSIKKQEKTLISQKNTAQVVEESRKEPVLPQEGLPDPGQQPVQGNVRLQPALPDKLQDIKRQPVDAGLENQPGNAGLGQQPVDKGLGKESDNAGLRNQPGNAGLGQQPVDKGLGKESDNAGLRNQPGIVGLTAAEDQAPPPKQVKAREDVLRDDGKENQNSHEGEERVLNDEVRISERKILNNAGDVVKKRTNISLTDQRKLPVEKPVLEKHVSNKNIVEEPAKKYPVTENEITNSKSSENENTLRNVRNKTIENVQVETKPARRLNRDFRNGQGAREDRSALDDSNTRKDIIKRRIKAPLIFRKHKKNSKVKHLKEEQRSNVRDI